jgi:hypothetical protein
MAKNQAEDVGPIRSSVDGCIERLGTILRAMEMMDSEERSAALRYIKQRYPKEWPSSDY